jgi:hypothetical protein
MTDDRSPRNSTESAALRDDGYQALEPAHPPPPAEAAGVARPAPLVAERSDFLEGDNPAAEKVEAFLAKALNWGFAIRLAVASK